MPRQALHAKELGFIHPRTGEKMFFSSDLAEDFNQLLNKIRKYTQTAPGIDGDDEA
jgi:23S rRNA pseudouridine1911/1915/1917 synthase